MERLTSEQLNIFISRLENRKYHKEELYDLLYDYLEEIDYNFDEDENAEVETEVFKFALEKGIIGYSIITTFTNPDIFYEKINQYIAKTKSHVFHFFTENEDEVNLSLGEIWNKWNDLPPMGWFAGWCHCGEFYPFTLDLGVMDIEKCELNSNKDLFKPEFIRIKEIKQIDFCDDGYIRFTMNDGKKFSAKPYKLDKGMVYNFISNPLDILK